MQNDLHTMADGCASSVQALFPLDRNENGTQNCVPEFLGVK